MYLILVLLFWASLVAGVVYRYRKIEVVNDFLTGFYIVWWAVFNAAEPDEPDNSSDALDYGAVAGIISVLLTLVLMVVVFALSIWWAI